MSNYPPSVGRLAVVLLAGAALGFTGCAVDPIPVSHDATGGTYFTRYALRGSQSGTTTILHRSNYLGLPVVAAPGESVNIVMYSASRIDLRVKGIPCQMFSRDLPFPTDDEGIRAFFAKYFVKSKDELQLQMIEERDRKPVMEGIAALGMTKNEVLLALGYPCQIDNEVPADNLPRDRIVESHQWIYRHSEFMGFPSLYIYQFNPADGTLVQRTP